MLPFLLPSFCTNIAPPTLPNGNQHGNQSLAKQQNHAFFSFPYQVGWEHTRYHSFVIWITMK